jgi:hypothetical protein
MPLSKRIATNSSITQSRIEDRVFALIQKHFDEYDEDFYDGNDTPEPDEQIARKKIVQKYVAEVLEELDEEDWIKLANDSNDVAGIAYMLKPYYDRYRDPANFYKAFKYELGLELVHDILGELNRGMGSVEVYGIQESKMEFKMNKK